MFFSLPRVGRLKRVELYQEERQVRNGVSIKADQDGSIYKGELKKTGVCYFIHTHI